MIKHWTVLVEVEKKMRCLDKEACQVLMLVCGASLVKLGFSWFSLAKVLES